MKFPVTIRHRTSKAKIYAPGGKFAYYRLAYTTAGKCRMQTFAAYSDAKAAGERIVHELANGSQAAALTASQSRDALAAFERLQGFYQASGRRVSLLAGISGICRGVRQTWRAHFGRSRRGLAFAAKIILNLVVIARKIKSQHAAFGNENQPRFQIRAALKNIRRKFADADAGMMMRLPETRLHFQHGRQRVGFHPRNALAETL